MQRAITLEVDGFVLRGMEHVPQSADPIPAVILFHGFTGNKLEPHRMFLKISRKLEDLGFAAFRFDFSGSGESDGDFEDMTLTREIREAHAILDMVREDSRVDQGKVILLGLSMGGLVASVVAAERTEDVHRLILLAPAGNMPDIVAQIVHAQGIDLSERSQPDPFDHGGNLVGPQFAVDVAEIKPLERAKGYDKPVVLIHGTEDPTVPFPISKRYVEEVYQDIATLHAITGANHTFDSGHWEREVIDRITEFLENV